jgi:hypothetical protein
MRIFNTLVQKKVSWVITLIVLVKKIFWNKEEIAGHISADAYTYQTNL